MSNKSPTTHPWDFDVRVRERNLKSGRLTDKDLEKYTTGLVDQAENADSASVPQPALGGRSD